MKKLLRTFWMMVLAMMMVLGSVGVCAADTQANGARALICECGGSLNGESFKYGSWSYTGNVRACCHGTPTKKDQERTRTVDVYWKCNSCGYLLYKTTRTQTEWKCMAN